VSGPYDDASEAMRLASAALPEIGKRPEDFRVVRTENLLAGADASPVRWRVVFKSRALLPDGREGKIGKGGEVFVEIDTGTGEAHQARGGD
jgi:hypothetical protein